MSSNEVVTITIERKKAELLLNKIKGCNESQCILTQRLSKCANPEKNEECPHQFDFESFLEGKLMEALK